MDYAASRKLLDGKTPKHPPRNVLGGILEAANPNLRFSMVKMKYKKEVAECIRHLEPIIDEIHRRINAVDQRVDDLVKIVAEDKPPNHQVHRLVPIPF